MRRIYAIVLGLFALGFWQNTNAQLNLNWDELGPNNMGNHVRAIKIDNAGNIWAGSVGGGLWKSSDKGQTWSMVADIEDNLAVSAIAVDGNNIYVGTGETYFYEPSSSYISGSSNWQPDSSTTWNFGFFQYSGMVGAGVYVSNDGGSSWSHNNGTWNNGSTIYNNPFVSIQKIVSQGGRTFIATLEGLYYSDNGDLSNVTKASGTPLLEGDPIVDVEFSSNGVVLAATADSLFRSTDNGASFGLGINDSILPSSFLPGNQLGGSRIEIAVSPSNPSTLYVTGILSTNDNTSGVWRSTDAGINFDRIGPLESSTFQPFQNQGRYSLVMEVDPSNENSILLGGQKLYKYDDVNGWDDAASHNYIPGFSTNYVPTPILSLCFDPNDNTSYFIGTDAEIVGTFDQGQSFTFRTKGLNTSHMQGVSASTKWSVLASERYLGLMHKANGNPDPLQQQFNSTYDRTRGGIGRFSTTNPDYIITQTTDGGLHRSLTGGSTFESFYGAPITPIPACMGTDSNLIDRPDTATAGAGVYDNKTGPINPWILDEYITDADLMNDTNIQETPVWLFMCSGNFIWLCTNPFGTLDSVPTWNRITLDLISGTFTKPEFFTAVTVSGDADHVLYAATNYGKIFRIKNANDLENLDPCVDVVRVDTGQGMPTGWITDLDFSRGDAENLVVSYGGYNQLSSRVWITNDAKSGSMPTFRNITGDLPLTMPVYTAALHPANGVHALVIGTENGVFATDDDFTNSGSTINWDQENSTMGNVPVYDLNYRLYFCSDWSSPDYSYGPDYTLFAATGGRGIFRSRTLVSNDQPTLVGSGIEMGLAPNPIADLGKVMIELPTATEVTIDVYSITGIRMGRLTQRVMTPGHHEIDFNAESFAAGAYLLKAEFSNAKGNYYETIKAIVTK